MIILAGNVNTTILVSRKLKNELDSLKVHHRESYADVISKLVRKAHAPVASGKTLSRKEKRAREKLMIEGYKKMAKRDLALEREWAWASTEADRLLDDY